jgi:hypothetical protein
MVLEQAGSAAHQLTVRAEELEGHQLREAANQPVSPRARQMEEVTRAGPLFPRLEGKQLTKFDLARRAG